MRRKMKNAKKMAPWQTPERQTPERQTLERQTPEKTNSWKTRPESVLT